MAKTLVSPKGYKAKTLDVTKKHRLWTAVMHNKEYDIQKCGHVGLLQALSTTNNASFLD